MKQFVCLITAGWLFLSTTAQTSLCITTDKTTSLVFPFAIRHVDRGTKSILAETVKEVPNILFVKAATKNFSETNLSVVTDDGSVYAFTVCYESEPVKWVYKVPPNQKAAVANYANAILDNRQRTYGIKDKRWKMLAQLKGIYVKDNTMYFHLWLQNNSAVDYSIDQLRFYIRDKKKNKRTAQQENELLPLHIVGNTSLVKENSASSIVFALDKFTIPDAKYLAVQISEKNGGRHLSLKINNRKLMRAVQLPDIK